MNLLDTLQRKVGCWTENIGNSRYEFLICQYSNGAKNGAFQVFFKDSAVAVEGTYCDGQIVGKYIEYNEHDRSLLKAIKHYSDMEKLNGKYEYYHSNGRLKFYTYYVDDRRHGEYCEFYETGELWKKGQMKDDYKDGVWIFYGRSGEIEDSMTFERGKQLR